MSRDVDDDGAASDASSLSDADSVYDLTTGSVSSSIAGWSPAATTSHDVTARVSCDLSDPAVRWSYRGEGGANLVVSLDQQSSVVRFTKSKYPDKDHDCKVKLFKRVINFINWQQINGSFHPLH